MNSPQAFILRKVSEVWRYPKLAWGSQDRFCLLVLGLYRSRIVSGACASHLLARSQVITPRLKATRGLPVRLEIQNQSQMEIFDEMFLETPYRFELIPFVPDLVLDCGAYCGYFALLASARFPEAEISCYEPNPANFELLEKQCALGGLRARINREAVYVANENVGFLGSGCRGSIAPLSPAGADLIVPAIDLRDYMARAATRTLLWKLDIEGGEKDVLPWVLHYLPRRTACFVETHHSEDVCRPLIQAYQKAGFRAVEMRRRANANGSHDYVEWCFTRLG